jgi:meiotically up-regulated gene 157 (Mug157) protein
MSYPPLPQGLETAIFECRPASQPFVRNALNHLWFDACKRNDDGSVFVQTGDIPAMWIRDSTWQVMPLVRFYNDPQVFDLVVGVIKSQVKFLSIDPYANAFNNEPNGACWHKDFEDQSPWVFERKWELDSISGFLALSLELRFASGDSSHLTPEWYALVERVITLLEVEQSHDPQSYRFVRKNAPAHDYLSHDGLGAPFKPCGLVWDAFRPSDDACELPFHVPSNLHLAGALFGLTGLLKKTHPKLAKRANVVRNAILKAVKKHALVERKGIKIFAYEVDGLGNSVLMDDANYPSLLSEHLSLRGINKKAAANTSEFVASSQNPWFFSGSAASGVGSPHTGKNMVWPLGIAVQGLNARFEDQASFINLIEQTATKDLNIHESFDVNDPSNFTRQWFSWAEMTYVELVFNTL